MKALIGEQKPLEMRARNAIRKKKWKKAVALHEEMLKSNERDYALWNLLGDLQMEGGHSAQAVEAWRRALEGYALEGLFENTLGVARKILRRVPEEDDVYLLLSEAYLGLEYYADCLASVRSYLRLVKRRSEPELRALFRRILESGMRHPHLLEELKALYRDSQVDDIELQHQLESFVESRSGEMSSTASGEPDAAIAEQKDAAQEVDHEERVAHDDLIVLDRHLGAVPEEMPGLGWSSDRLVAAPPTVRDYSGEYVGSSDVSPTSVSAGDGKDHYDLGVVYRDMKLWDAAAAEFGEARRDPQYRVRATLGLAECLRENNDLQSALRLLEEERNNEAGSPAEKLNLHFQLGVIHELLGNAAEALRCFEIVRGQSSGHIEAEERIRALRSQLGTETEG